MRRDEGIPPYGRPGGRSRSGWPGTKNLFVGAGFTAPAGAFRRPTAAQRRLLGRRSRPRDLAAVRGSRDDASIVPYMGLRLPVGRAFAAARRGGPWPSRGPCGGAGCGGMRASRPTTARAAAAVPVGPRRKNIRRGGICCARRRVSEANRRAAAALRPEIPPAGPCAAAGFPGRCEHRPLQGFASPGRLGVCRGSQGRAMALPRDLAPAQAGPIWNRPLQRARNAAGFVTRSAANLPPNSIPNS